MPSDSGERRPSKANQAQVSAARPPDQEGHLPCPRCNSTSTKFCYYNNYNFSQPRHFCKTCRRYWTHGGTLRDIPVGGGSRKSTKRCRAIAASTTDSATYPPENHHIITNSTPIFVHHGEPVPFAAGEAKPTLNMFGSFTSLLNPPSPGMGLFTLGGFGLGSGFEDVGFGLGRPVWPYTGVEEGGDNPASVIGNTWLAENGYGAFGGGDCFSLPGLAISAPGNPMK